MFISLVTWMAYPYVFYENSTNFFNENAGKNYGNSNKLDLPILAVSNIQEGETILDIGCGEGRFLNLLSEKYKNITLVAVVTVCGNKFNSSSTK